MAFVCRSASCLTLFACAYVYSANGTRTRKPWEWTPLLDPHPQRMAYAELMNHLSPHGSGKLDMKDAQEWFNQAQMLFGTPNVSTAHFKYGWRHLPAIIMEHKKIHFVLHRGHLKYTKRENDIEVRVFAGWQSEGGAYYNPECGDDCTIHVNLRDIFTDAHELISNLLLLNQFFGEHAGKTVYRCFDDSNMELACKSGGLCSLNLATVPDCKVQKAFILGPDTPSYSVEFNGRADEEVAGTITEWWTPWAEALKKEAVELTGCDASDLKVHFAEGATEGIWLQTSAYAVDPKYHRRESDEYNGKLEGSYGGQYKEQDELYAQFNLARRANSSLNDQLNDMNKGKHQYISGRDPWSANVEIISMESWKAGEVDPVITEELLANSVAGRKCAVLMNAAYVFGSSSYCMGSALKNVFGDALKTFYVLGKAGGLRGRLGDYQFADTLALWSSMYLGSSAGITDDKGFRVYKVNHGGVEPDASLWSGGGERYIHRGVNMNFPAVVLESLASLHDATAQPWNAVGIEMEGAWFQAALSGVPGLYMYYTSDLPMQEGSTLAHESYPWREGQTLFNGLIRIMFKHLLTILSKDAAGT